jgi:hypothetical protein
MILTPFTWLRRITMKTDGKDICTLKIRPLHPPPEKQRMSFRLPASTVAAFQSYLAAYADIYGMDADPDFVADRIFNAFFESDKAFAAYLEKGATDHADSRRFDKSHAVLGGEGAPLGKSHI